MNPVPDTAPAARSSNATVAKRLLILALLMFGFGYAMVPLYEKFCEITGINSLTKPDSQAARFAGNTQVDTSRTVSVEFDVNSRGAWRFVPEVRSAQVHPGELFTVVYELVNTEDRVTTGQAIPSYAPRQAASYFRKVQCFCFDQQTLGPGGRQSFPVVFVVDPDLPADITTITLSYTYFEVGAPGGQAAVPGGVRGE